MRLETKVYAPRVLIGIGGLSLYFFILHIVSLHLFGSFIILWNEESRSELQLLSPRKPGAPGSLSKIPLGNEVRQR